MIFVFTDRRIFKSIVSFNISAIHENLKFRAEIFVDAMD